MRFRRINRVLTPIWAALAGFLPAGAATLVDPSDRKTD
jgi:hypothetical protein